MACELFGDVVGRNFQPPGRRSQHRYAGIGLFRSLMSCVAKPSIRSVQDPGVYVIYMGPSVCSAHPGRKQDGRLYLVLIWGHLARRRRLPYAPHHEDDVVGVSQGQLPSN